MPLSYIQKLVFLKEMKARKRIIFGQFEDPRDGKTQKKAAWEHIATILQSNGYAKNYAFLRDSEWPNLRVRASSKFNKITGEAIQVLDEVDQLVLDILKQDDDFIPCLNFQDSQSLNSSKSDNFIQEVSAIKEEITISPASSVEEVNRSELLNVQMDSMVNDIQTPETFEALHPSVISALSNDADYFSNQQYGGASASIMNTNGNNSFSSYKASMPTAHTNRRSSIKIPRLSYSSMQSPFSTSRLNVKINKSYQTLKELESKKLKLEVRKLELEVIQLERSMNIEHEDIK